MILLRTWHGIADHFPFRWSEWIMAYPALGMAAALELQPDMFSLAPTFHTLAEWGDEAAWGYAILGCGTLRLIALAVNGTFEAFRYAPHIRVAAAIVAGFFWSQFSLGILFVALSGEGAWSGVVAYSTLALIELFNVFRASQDIGAWVRSRKDAAMD
jgi:hypothetical protein